jgi:hypothetical protein
VLETRENRLEKSWLCTANCCSVWVYRTVRCARQVQGEPAALRTRRRRTAIIHWTDRWCTGLSDESSAAKSSLSRKVQQRTTKIHRTVRWCTGLSGEPTVNCATVSCAIRGRRVARANGQQGAPDCPVHQLPRRCNGRLRHIRKEIAHRT